MVMTLMCIYTTRTWNEITVIEVETEAEAEIAALI
jgi:hypothetical protein